MWREGGERNLGLPMPPTFVYAMALMCYLAVACVVWLIALILAVRPQTRTLARQLAVGMACSFPGVFVLQLLVAPVVVGVLLVVAGIFTVFDPRHGGQVILILAAALILFGIVAVASLLGFYTGWRAGWEFAAGRSVRTLFRNDRLLGPVVRAVRKRVPRLEKFL